MTRNRIAFAVFALGSIASAVWAFYNLQPLSDFFHEGGGFVGGTADTIDALRYVLAPAAVFAISRFVRAQDGVARGLRRVHLAFSASVVALLVIFIVATALGRFTHGIDDVWFALLVATFIGGALWLPVQSFFTAGFLSLLIKGPAQAGHYE
jgi:hypothetical protein